MMRGINLKGSRIKAGKYKRGIINKKRRLMLTEVVPRKDQEVQVERKKCHRLLDT